MKNVKLNAMQQNEERKMFYIRNDWTKWEPMNGGFRYKTRFGLDEQKVGVQFKCTSRVKPEIGSMQSLRIYPRTRRVPAWVIRGKRDRRWRKRDKLIESSKMLLKYLLNDKTSSLLAEKIHDTRRIKPIWLVRLHSNIDYCSRSLSCLSLSLCCLEQFTLSLIQDEKVPLKIHDFGCWRLSNWCDSLNPSSE